MRIKTLGATAAAVAATAIVGGAATSRDVNSPWYARLRKPSYQPPPKVFPIVWPLLYTDLALVSTDTIDHLADTGEEQAARSYSAALGLNLVLNAGWSWVFFNRHRPGLAALTAGALTASSLDLTRRAVQTRGVRGGPLAAYPAWCAFATVLSTHIWWLNCRR